MKRTINVTIPVEIEIKDNEIDKVLVEYCECIHDSGGISDVFEHIAYNIVVNEERYSIEGIGLIKEKTFKKSNEPVIFEIKRDEIESCEE